MSKLNLTQSRWNDIKNNNSNADDQFIYAVKSTMIFCKPSCSAKLHVKENVTLYNDYNDAIVAGYRPCKKCNPTGHFTDKEEWCIQIKNYIIRHYHQPVSLEELANHCHGSLYHLSRVFKDLEGMTIMDYLHLVRTTEAKKLLADQTLDLNTIALAVGYKTASQFIKKFKLYFQLTPHKFRQQYTKL